jgi:hypothetical protein
MRSRISCLWVLLVSMLAHGASAVPLDVTYSVSVEVAASSGLTPNRQFAGTLTIRFPGGGDLSLGGALSYDGQIELLGGTLTATGAPLELTSGPVSSIVFPNALSFPYGTSFVSWVVPGFVSEGNVVPGQLALDFTAQFPPDAALGNFFAPEISRQLVPEPSAAGLLALGTAAGWLGARAQRM